MPGLRPSTLAVLGAASLAFAGCSHTHQVASNRTVNVALSEYQLNPSSIRMRAGAVTIAVHNYGRLNHNLVVSRNGVTMGQTKPVAPGQTTDLVLDLLPGTYSMTSTIANDQALGAYGTLKVGS
jgi:hypothetical protein